MNMINVILMLSEGIRKSDVLGEEAVLAHHHH